MKKIYVFGNFLLKEDNLPLLLIEKLKEKLPSFEFIIADPNENFPPKKQKELIILDTVLGINKPVILDLDDFEKKKKTPISLHDYDLLFHLFLLKKLKKIKTAKVIGLPVIKKKGDLSFLVKKICQLVLNLDLDNSTKL